MADAAVVITSGTGTNIDTRTEATNGNHRQVVVLGDPSTNAGVAPVDVTNGLSVTLTTALPAGSAAIGKLSANSGVDIGDVDITSIAAGDNNIGNVDVVTLPTLPAGTNYVGKVRLTDGTTDTDVRDLTNSNALNVAIVDGSGDQVTSFGGGTQYTEDAAAAANPVGTALNLVRDDARGGSLTTLDGDNVAARGTNSGELYVKHVDTIPVTQSGAWSVTANAGTNLNTSTLALESGGNLATIKTNTDKIPAVGQALMAASTPVVVASNQSAIPVSFTGSTDVATQTTLAAINAKLVSGTDIGDVTINNASGAAAVNVQDGGNSLTVDGTVAVSGSVAVTNAGTFVTQENGALLTSAQLIDDVVYTDDTSTHATGTSKGVGIMATATPTDTSVNANDIGMVAMTTDRRLLVDASGVAVPVTDNSGSLTVDYATTGSGTATGALRVELPTNGTGVIATVGAVTAITNALPAGSNAIGKLAANSGVDIGDVDVTSIVPGTGATNLGKAEDSAHTSADVGVMALGVRTDVPNAVGAGTTGEYSFLATDMAGGVRTALYETDFAVLGTSHVKKYYTNAGAVTDGIIWSPAAGKRWYVTDIYIQVSAAATVTLEDDLAGGDSPIWKGELAANSGWSHSFTTPWFSGEDAADLIITTSAGNVYVTAVGYEI